MKLWIMIAVFLESCVVLDVVESGFHPIKNVITFLIVTAFIVLFKRITDKLPKNYDAD
jgi:hypothetical protein